ncbi:MAG: DUF1349 domain-containing protein, partial [Pirellulales bacterium]|nr:DUF1349 domain-containing protein [Pirellulales bacterium]
KPLRPDADHQSLTKNPGKLTITTQHGSIHRAGPAPLAKNLFLLDVPQRDEPDFVVTTCLEGFRPMSNWQQAGLIVYNDDDNYLKLVCEFSIPGQSIVNALAETQGQSTITKFWVPLSPERVWLRLVKRGNVYECSSSDDGKTFHVYADVAWGTAPPKQVGLLAKNGSSSRLGGVDAVFDFFEFRRITREEKNDPSPGARAKLLGSWKVVAGQLDGKPMASPESTSFTVTASEFTLAENTRKLVGSYRFGGCEVPKTLTLYARTGTMLTPLNWAYTVQEDELVLCLTPKADAPAPDRLESRAGDGRMLITLKRAAEGKD